MALPEAARKQLEEAERLHAEAYASENESETPPDEGETPPEGETTLQVVDGAAEGEQTPPADENRENTVEYWQHKYNVLKGKYDAEVPRLQQSNNALQGRVGEIEQQMQTLLTQQAQAPSEQTPSTESLLTQDEIEDYGQDMIDVVKKAAREEFAPQLSSLQQENEQLRGLLAGQQQVTARTARDAMLETLDRDIPDWRELNVHPDFLGWLEGIDAYSGQKRLDMLRQSFEGNNAPRVSAFFKGFKNENAAYTPAPEPGDPAQPQVNLDTLVAPGRASEGGEVRAQEPEAAGRIWTQAEIQTFYSDVQKGKYRLDPEGKDRIEAEIFLAQSQGRIK